MKNGSRRRSSQEVFGTTPFQTKESAIFDIERALQGDFRSFAEKGRGPDPKNPLVARLVVSQSHDDYI